MVKDGQKACHSSLMIQRGDEGGKASVVPTVGPVQRPVDAEGEEEAEDGIAVGGVQLEQPVEQAGGPYARLQQRGIAEGELGAGRGERREQQPLCQVEQGRGQRPPVCVARVVHQAEQGREGQGVGREEAQQQLLGLGL